MLNVLLVSTSLYNREAYVYLFYIEIEMQN